VRLAAALLALQAVQLYVLPAWLLSRSPWWALLLVALLPAGQTMYGLTHEAVHRVLHPSPVVNRRLGRALAVAFGASFDVFRTVHLLHHKHNRTERERVEVLGWRGREGWKARVVYYVELVGGGYFAQILGVLALPFLPKSFWERRLARPDETNSYVTAALRAMSAPATLAGIRQDAIAFVLVWGPAFALYGRRWPLLLGAMAARAFLQSVLNYVYHYGSPLGGVVHGYDLGIPGGLSKVILHFNYHGVHHRNPALPWNALPVVFRREQRAFDASLARAAARQFRGPVPESALRAAAS
jgi:fatty acid desaturase